MARYGLNLVKIKLLVSDLLSRFDTIYDIQKRGVAFRTVPELLQAMSGDHVFTTMTQANAAKYLSEEVGLSDVILEQFVSGAMRMNYNQNVDALNAFVAAVSLAGVEDGLWCVNEGNHRVCEGLLKLAKAQVKQQTVETVERVSTTDVPHYRVTTANGQSSLFDFVVLSVPLELANIAFKEFPSTPPTLPMSNYQKVHVTFVKGHPSRGAVSLNPLTSDGQFPELVLTAKNDSIPFLTICQQLPIDASKVRGAPVWKIFSRQRMTNKLLNKLFLDREDVVRAEFMAYPRYSPPEQFVPFVLDDRLFYNNAIERAASAMEMSAVAGMNAALLVKNALNDSQ